MMKLKLILPLLALAAGLFAWPVSAHGFGQRTELPVPLGYFLIGAALAVAFSFVLLAVFVKGDGASGYWRYNLLRLPGLRWALTSPLLLTPLKALSVFLLALVIATGTFGEQVPTLNFAPTLVWIIWWVGMAFAVALVGNLWAFLNPWKAVYDLLEFVTGRSGSGRGLSLGLEYPRRLGVVPAVALFMVFTWTQDAFSQSDLPNLVASMAIVYSIITLSGMALYGKHVWLRYGDAFSVVFRFWARFSPTEVRVRDTGLCGACPVDCLDRDGECVDCYECFQRSQDRELNVRPWAVGLARNEAVGNDVLAVVVLLLASVTFDGFSATSAWLEFRNFIVDGFGGGGSQAFNSLTLADTLGVALFPVGFFLVYLLFSQLMSGSSDGRLGAMELARLFAFSLIPIALAYNIAHFVTLLVVQGQLLVPLVSDPFGKGWDLFGTVGYTVNIAVINARVLWFLSVAVIVVGHILAVYLSHKVAMRTFNDRSAALNSQYPMLTLMVVYTVVSLWIIAQPIVV